MWVECWALPAKRVCYDGWNLPVAGDGLEGAIVATEGDLEADNRVAGLNQFEVLRVDASLSGGGVIEQLNLLEEARLAVLVQVGAGRFDSLGELSAEDCTNVKSRRVLPFVRAGVFLANESIGILIIVVARPIKSSSYLL